MSNGLIGIGLSALNAAQAGMTTTSENISNVNTTGYSDESVLQQSAPTVFTGAGYVGQGVSVLTVTRAYNAFQALATTQAQASSSSLSTQYAQVQQIDNILGDPSSGLSAAMDTFFGSLQSVASDPSDVSTRETAIGDGQALSSSFNTTQAQLSELDSQSTTAINQSVANVNSYAQQIASLNAQILQSAGSSQQPNTLLDQRDALVNQLNQEIGATTITQSNGALDVFIGNGQALVTGSQANTLTATASASNPGQINLGISSGSGTVALASSQITGGNLAGQINFRTQSLVPTESALGRIALVLANAVNGQNEVGQDLNGSAGQALFSVSGPEVIAAQGNSAGSGLSATITNASALTTDNYRVSFDGTNYSVTDLSTNATTSSTTMPQTVDGITFGISGSMAAGDSFTVDATANAASSIALSATDPTLIAAATPVVSALGENNTGSLAVTGLTVAGPPVNSAAADRVTVTFSGSGAGLTYSASDATTGVTLASNVAYSAGSSISLNGWSLALNGTPAAGDTVSVIPNVNGTSDGSNALAMADLQNAPLIGKSSLSSAYQQIVSQVGTQTDNLQSRSTAQASILTAAQTAQASTSGVNLDDEAANLLKYQQAYQAASQTIVAANTIFNSILALFTNA